MQCAMKELETIILSDALNTKGVSTILFIVLILIVKSVLSKTVLRSKIEIDEKRKWVIRLRNWTTIIACITVFLIWFTEIQSVALSLAALAVAIAVSLKELIMSFSWGFMRSFNQPFKVGDGKGDFSS